MEQNKTNSLSLKVEDSSSFPLPSTDNKATTSENVIKKPGSIQNFKNEDFRYITSWLEDPVNFASIYGTSRPKKTYKPMRESKKGYCELAEVLYRMTNGRLNLSANEVREQFGKHKTLYMKTKALSISAGFGVTNLDRLEGIYTLELFCPYFTTIDQLFEYKPESSEIGISIIQEFLSKKKYDLEGADKEDEIEDDVQDSDMDISGGSSSE
ncbi:hypothetical protein BGZ46_002293 [Entomortierella lignicola]|nr:hypothetical protein BGZ46_002293 [Entomortierella lignicola]